MNRNRALPFALITLLAVVSASAGAQSRWNNSIVGISNIGNNMYVLDGGTFFDGSPSTASAGASYTGLDGGGILQTMTFSGQTTTSAQYGQLHSATSLAVANSYYNPANTLAYDNSVGVYNPNGSPDTMNSLGFAGFTDTLQFGGALQAGYMARYIFHVDGTCSGPGALADLAFNVEGYTGEGFFAYDQGFNDKIWATQSYAINGITPQTVSVQFSTQYVFDAFTRADGTNESGFADFSSTLTLQQIQVVDANGMPVDGVTVTSGSGTHYNTTPEPGVPLTLSLGLGTVLFLRRRRG